MYLSQPIFYRIESCKDRIVAYHKKYRKKVVDEDSTVLDFAGSIYSPVSQSRQDPHDLMNFTTSPIKKEHEPNYETYLDPFMLPKPWRIQIVDGKTRYFNEATQQVSYTKPTEVNWLYD